VEAVVERMKAAIAWDAKPTTVTTDTFKRIKDFVLQLKEQHEQARVIVEPHELMRLLKATDPSAMFADAEMMTCGYQKRGTSCTD
jgi:hypothetical protein